MFDEVLICLDGSLFAESIIPYARGIADPVGANLVLLRVIEDTNDFSAADGYVQGWARFLKARGKVVVAKGDVPATILGELRQRPNAIPAITTHGRTGVLESLLGSVALGIIRGAGRPVLLHRPGTRRSTFEKQVRFGSLVTALDGSNFSEKILPFVAEMARTLRLKLQLVQVLSKGTGQIPPELAADVLEVSYVRRCAEYIEEKYRLEVDWDVLHGDPREAICSHVKERKDLILAMTSRARSGLEQAIFGSVAGECVRHAGVPMLIYCPGP